MKSIQTYNDVLGCPKCGEYNLHQLQTDVYFREEDEPEGVHVNVDKKLGIVDRSMSDNPSGRRSGMRIQFYCEHCDNIKFLVIYQHKGETFIYWEDKEEEGRP